MSERSRDEKLAAAKKKLKKYQENTSKGKSKDEKTWNVLTDKKTPQYSNSSSNYQCAENQDFNKSVKETGLQNQCNEIESGPSTEEPTATTESLKQISRHLNGIISRSSSSIDRESQQEHLNTIRELEKRNVELANLNSQKAEQLEFLNSKIGNLNETIDRIAKEHQNEKVNLENSFRKQIESNRNQLQAQIHTISLLVAEKSELQSQVAHNQKLANQRFQDIEDLTNKLKISRQKVGDLEKSLNEVKLLSDKSEEFKRDMSRQIEHTRNDLKKHKLEKDDLLSECSQLRSKLMSKTQEISNLELTLDDIKSELEMSQVQIQHLTNNQEGHYDNLCSQLKTIDKKNLELTKELESTKLHLQQTESQNNRLQAQYRNYFEQMEERLKSSQSEIHILTEEKVDLIYQLEHLKTDITKTEPSEAIDNAADDYENVINQLTNEKSTLEYSNATLTENNTVLVSNNEQLMKAIEELEGKNADLVEKNRQFESSQIDYTQLLSQLKSDKTALSRALAQNKQLKSQLVELQETFVKLSSDNMDYLIQLQHENHVSKELASRLGEQEEELNEMRQLLAKKDEEISKLLHSNQQITEEILTLNNNTENNLAQRSESHFNMANKVVIENLQSDLINSQERINKLTTENNNLTYQLNRNFDKLPSVTDNKDSNSEINKLILSLRQIEAERDELLAKCETLHLKEKDLTENLNKLKESKNENGFANLKDDFQCMQEINSQITEKLQDATEKNALLTKENYRLEHLVEQLEGETDTIAEYINLYQHQRTLLKQKCAIRDQLMSKLNHQKQLIENKLITLENLIKMVMKSGRDSWQKTIGSVNGEVNDDVSPPCDQQERKLNIHPSVVDQIFSIIHELQTPSDDLSQPYDNYTSRNEKHKLDSSSFDSALLSDDLLHYHIIHCKCCVGKVIDL